MSTNVVLRLTARRPRPKSSEAKLKPVETQIGRRRRCKSILPLDTTTLIPSYAVGGRSEERNGRRSGDCERHTDGARIPTGTTRES